MIRTGTIKLSTAMGHYLNSKAYGSLSYNSQRMYTGITLTVSVVLKSMVLLLGINSSRISPSLSVMRCMTHGKQRIVLLMLIT